jgi:peptide/nickel transport system ATP-binding protein/oligopeptide transport system ATP-binding protein
MKGDNNMSEIALEVKNLSKHFTVRKSVFSKIHVIHAVKQINFKVETGESLGLIGESGSGKTTIANMLVKLLDSSEGRIELFGHDITHLSDEDMRHHRKDIQIIFQYTHAVLDPKMTVEELILEPLKIHRVVKVDDMNLEVDRLLEIVGLSKTERKKFPSQLSGGQNQRIIIARAIATRAKVMICDEPVSALDVSVQGQILNLLLKLKKELNLTYVFITHDLNVVKHMCNRIAVMYQGQVVEIGGTKEMMMNPKNEYTKRLLKATLI